MKTHDSISFFRTPQVWLRDKFQTALGQRSIYVIASLPGVFMLLGFTADMLSLFHFNESTVIILLLSYLFVFGLINLWFITIIQRTGVRLQRQKSTSKVMHKVLAEGLREYVTYKNHQIDNHKPLNSEEIKKYILDILDGFNKQYLSVFYSPYISIALKYLNKDHITPLRTGENVSARNHAPEHIEKSFVYQALSRSGNKLSYLYIKNLNKLDQKETSMLSGFETEIKRRALGKYETFIALPIRSGRLLATSSEFTSRPDLGIIGFDLQAPYGFGNLEENEIHMMLSLSDLLAEPVNDLIEISKQ